MHQATTPFPPTPTWLTSTPKSSLSSRRCSRRKLGPTTSIPSTTIDLTGKEKGVIVSCGGMTGGYAMYIKDGKLHYDYNYLDGVHYHLTSPALPMGSTKLEFVFKRTGFVAGEGELFVNGKLVDSVDMPKMHISTYSLAETFDIGCDLGTQVDKAYEGSPFNFESALDRVLIRMMD